VHTFFVISTVNSLCFCQVYTATFDL